MTKRSKGQKIGSKGHKWTMSVIEENDGWIARDLSEDFGIDAEAELDIGEIKGEILKFQFKSTKSVTRKNGKVKFVINRKYIRYAMTCRYPVIFLRIDIAAKQAWYLWLQEWILRQSEQRHDVIYGNGSVTTWVSDKKNLSYGLATELKDIARWRGDVQLVLSLLDSMRAAAATLRINLVKQIVDVLALAAPTLTGATVDLIVRQAALLGGSLRGTSEGFEIGEQLFSVLRKLGVHTTLNTVLEMVVRGDSYSRTGLVGLAILYDEYFEHIKALKLVEYFSTHGLPHVAYYCQLRELNPEKKEFAFVQGPGELVFAGLRFDYPDRLSFANKYANRGPSAILDYLVPASAQQ